MQKEMVVAVEVLFEGGHAAQARLFVRFVPEIHMILQVGEQTVSSSDFNYSECLLGINKQLPAGVRLKFVNPLLMGQQVLQIEEFVSEYVTADDHDDVLAYELRCEHDGKVWEGKSVTEFCYALESLQKQLGQVFHICAYCKHGEFKSNGAEDLRHGWYCFREIEGSNKELPWHEREDEFEKAIPNVSAFHWCSRFAFDDQNKF